MTDNEIIKALECCKAGDGKCSECPYRCIRKCIGFLHKDTLDLINRQKAAIEKLKEELQKQKMILEDIDNAIYPLPFETDFDRTIEHAKSEAIKEFAERVKKTLSEFDMSSVGLPDYDRGYADCKTAIEDAINDLEEEMTEE